MREDCHGGQRLADANGDELRKTYNCWRTRLIALFEAPTSRVFGSIVLFWGMYIGTVELVAHAAANRDRNDRVPVAQLSLLHGFVDDAKILPPLARWDSIWFYGIANEGYGGTRGDQRFTPAFLPLYPLLMRSLARTMGTDPLTAGLWISRLSLLITLLLLANGLTEDAREASALSAPAALLAFPSAFLLISVYSESLFLVLAIGALVCGRRGHYMSSALCAFAASCTRIQGIALVAALAMLALERRRSRTSSLICVAPAVAGAAAYAAMAGYSFAAFGHPLYHFIVRRALWHQGTGAPWSAFAKAMDDALSAARLDDLGSVYTLLQLPCIYLVLVTILILFGRAAHAHGPEIAFTACSLAMSLFAGAIGGVPRFTLVLFPVFNTLARLSRWPSLWQAYLVLSALLQACLIIHFVAFRPPSP